jgi:hypothetical protein
VLLQRRRVGIGRRPDSLLFGPAGQTPGEIWENRLNSGVIGNWETNGYKTADSHLRRE